MNPKISVVIPTYESEARIGYSLDSVLKQTLYELEIIIVWLKGRDETELKIKSYVSDHRVKLVEQTEKTGPGGSREIGVSVATGKFIGFVDSDDCISQDFYQRLYEAAERVNADIAFGEINKARWKRSCVYSSFADKYSLLENGAIFDKIFSKDLIVKNNIHFPQGIFYEDNPWVLKAFWHSNKLVTVPSARYFYWEWDRISDRLPKLIESSKKVALIYSEFMESVDMSNKERSLVRSKFVRHCFPYEYMREEDVTKIKKIFGCFPEFSRFIIRKKRRMFFRSIFHISLRRKEINFMFKTYHIGK